ASLLSDDVRPAPALASYSVSAVRSSSPLARSGVRLRPCTHGTARAQAPGNCAQALAPVGAAMQWRNWSQIKHAAARPLTPNVAAAARNSTMTTLRVNMLRLPGGAMAGGKGPGAPVRLDGRARTSGCRRHLHRPCRRQP